MIQWRRSIIGGFFMARSYRHIQGYEEELLALKAQGMTVREIGERWNFDASSLLEILILCHRGLFVLSVQIGAVHPFKNF